MSQTTLDLELPVSKGVPRRGRGRGRGNRKRALERAKHSPGGDQTETEIIAGKKVKQDKADESNLGACQAGSGTDDDPDGFPSTGSLSDLFIIDSSDSDDSTLVREQGRPATGPWPGAEFSLLRTEGLHIPSKKKSNISKTAINVPQQSDPGDVNIEDETAASAATFAGPSSATSTPTLLELEGIKKSVSLLQSSQPSLEEPLPEPPAPAAPASASSAVGPEPEAVSLPSTKKKAKMDMGNPSASTASTRSTHGRAVHSGPNTVQDPSSIYDLSTEFCHLFGKFSFLGLGPARLGN